MINSSESEVAINAAGHTENYCRGDLAVAEYLTNMLGLAHCYALDCSYDHIDMNGCVLKALRFILDFEMVKNQRTSFMIKSASLGGDDPAERSLISALPNELESATRNLLVLDGGRLVLSAAAVVGAESLVIPFKVQLGNVELLFDELEPSPALESDETDADPNDKCLEVVESYSAEQPVEDSLNIFIEASATRSITVKVSSSETTSLTAGCEFCFGYTTKGVRCKNLRKALGKEKVLCYHHKNQELEY